MDDLPHSWLNERDTPQGWQARDVVGHLISAELDDWLPRAEIILRHGTRRPFTPFDRFQHEERDVGIPLSDLIDRFASLRAEGIRRLREMVLDDSDLDRLGRHPELGEVTLRQHVATWTVHDLDHVAQIYSALAASRDADVGPWKQYLGSLVRRDEPGSSSD
jgi:hypothetical protein